jgi:peroxiredoxin
MKKHSHLTAIAALLTAAMTITSCTGEQFHIAGTMTDAKDSVLYLENMGLDGPVVVDSVRLDAAGQFDFAGDAVAAPEFYRLRIAGQIINLAIDSTETVNVKASYPTMATAYEVGDSYENMKIKELALKQIDLQAQVQAVADNPQLAGDSLAVAIERMIKNYKDEVTRNYIYKEPMKAYAYFALFQYITVNRISSLLFNPTVYPEDIKVFGAVATSWDTYYPGSRRGENLHNIALNGMKDQRNIQNQEAQAHALDSTQVTVTGVIDLPLVDNKGQLRHLTELKGKVVLLNFHLFAMDGSNEFIMHLREIYNKYHAQGLEIYQVSLDDNEHFWKTQTAALPWICVHDYGQACQAYLAPVDPNVSAIMYLIDRDNNIVKNPMQIKDLESEIRALL